MNGKQLSSLTCFLCFVALLLHFAASTVRLLELMVMDIRRMSVTEEERLCMLESGCPRVAKRLPGYKVNIVSKLLAMKLPMSAAEKADYITYMRKDDAWCLLKSSSCLVQECGGRLLMYRAPWDSFPRFLIVVIGLIAMVNHILRPLINIFTKWTLTGVELTNGRLLFLFLLYFFLSLEM